MKKILVAIAAAALLSACAQTPATPGAVAEQTGSNRPAATSEAPVADVAEPEPEFTAPEEADDEPVAFGSSKVYTDGLQVTVSKGKSFKPSDTSAGGDGFKSFVKYTITIVNGTGKVFDASMFSSSAQSGNVEADEIYDTDMGGAPGTKLLKGRESKFSVGYGVTDPKDVVLEVTPSFEHNSVLFN